MESGFVPNQQARPQRLHRAQVDAIHREHSVEQKEVRALQLPRTMQSLRPRLGGVEPTLFLGDADVPDPYYGTGGDFERVVALARDGVCVLIERLRELRAMGG